MNQITKLLDDLHFLQRGLRLFGRERLDLRRPRRRRGNFARTLNPHSGRGEQSGSRRHGDESRREHQPGQGGGFLEYQVALLKKHGIEDIVFATNYMAEKIGALIGGAYAAVVGGIVGLLLAIFWNAAHVVFLAVVRMRASLASYSID